MRGFRGCDILNFLLYAFPLCLANPIVRESSESSGYHSHLRHIDLSKEVSISTHIPPFHGLKGQSSHSEGAHANTSPALHRRHGRIVNQLPRLSLPLTERGALSDLRTQGFRWIWEKGEVILDSVEAYNKHHHMYDEMIRQREESSGNEILRFAANLVMTYGSLKMTFENLPGGHGSAEDFIRQFALQMLSLCTVGMVYGTYKIAVMLLSSTVWVTLQIVEYGPIPELIG